MIYSSEIKTNKYTLSNSLWTIMIITDTFLFILLIASKQWNQIITVAMDFEVHWMLNSCVVASIKYLYRLFIMDQNSQVVLTLTRTEDTKPLCWLWEHASQHGRYCYCCFQSNYYVLDTMELLGPWSIGFELSPAHLLYWLPAVGKKVHSTLLLNPQICREEIDLYQPRRYFPVSEWTLLEFAGIFQILFS